MTRILVTGSRTWRDADRLGEQIAEAMGRFTGTDFVIVHGACPQGADRLADLWAADHGIRVERHPANWGRFGRKAGMVRNEEMAMTWPDYGVAFAEVCPKPRCVFGNGDVRPKPHFTHGVHDMMERLALHRIPYALVISDRRST